MLHVHDKVSFVIGSIAHMSILSLDLPRVLLAYKLYQRVVINSLLASYPFMI